MSEDHGTDFYCTDDLEPNLRVVSGRECLRQALLRRLITPRGSLFFDPNYGTDLRAFLASSARASEIAQAVEAECLKDERVEDVSSLVTPPATNSDPIVVRLSIVDADGPFPLTVAVSSLTVKLLEESL